MPWDRPTTVTTVETFKTVTPSNPRTGVLRYFAAATVIGLIHAFKDSAYSACSAYSAYSAYSAKLFCQCYRSLRNLCVCVSVCLCVCVSVSFCHSVCVCTKQYIRHI